MNAAELAARSERVFVVGAELFFDEPVYLVRDEEVRPQDAGERRRQTSTLNAHSRYPHEGVVRRPERLVALAFGHEHTDAFVAACEEKVRELH